MAFAVVAIGCIVLALILIFEEPTEKILRSLARVMGREDRFSPAWVKGAAGMVGIAAGIMYIIIYSALS